MLKGAWRKVTMTSLKRVWSKARYSVRLNLFVAWCDRLNFADCDAAGDVDVACRRSRRLPPQDKTKNKRQSKMEMSYYIVARTRNSM